MNRKKLLIVAVLVLSAITLVAQDVILTNDDNVIKAYNVEIGKNAIFYQTEDNESAPIQKIAKSDVFIIKKADGTKIDPNEEDMVKTSVTVASTVSDEVYVDTEEVAKKNKQLIDEWNSIHFELQMEKKKSNAKHNPSIVKLGIKQTSQLTDGNIQVRYNVESSKYWKFESTVSITVENKTDKIIYVDMANSFYTSNRGVKTMYSNKIESKTNANAVGVGFGFIGGASANAKTTVSTETRMIAIPPKGIMILPYKISAPFVRTVYMKNKQCYYKVLSPNESSDNEQLVEISTLFVNPVQNMFATTLEELPIGCSIDFTEADNNVEMYTLISYSFSENGQNLNSVRTDFFLQQILKMNSSSDVSIGDKSIGVENLTPLQASGMVFGLYDNYNIGRVKYEWYCKE